MNSMEDTFRASCVKQEIPGAVLLASNRDGQKWRLSFVSYEPPYN